MAEARQEPLTQRISNGVNSLEKIITFALDIFFPVFCVGCGHEGQYICTRCKEFVGEASLICPVCEESTFTGETHETCKGRHTLDGLVGVWEYEGVLKQLLLAIKYGGIAHAVQETMERAFFAMAQDTARFSPFLSFLFEKDTVLAFVPMWKPKERRRGYNQAALAARSLGTMCNKIPEALLKKIRDTKSQTALKKKERLQNVKNSFEVAEQTLNKTRNIRGKIPERVVLVDDIWTSGATMRECAKVLKKAGAGKVWAFTLARTV